MAETLDPKITKTAARLFAVLQKEQLYWRGRLGPFWEGEGKGAEAIPLSYSAYSNAHPLVPWVTTPTCAMHALRF